MSDARGSKTAAAPGTSRRGFLGGAALATGGAGAFALTGAELAAASQHGFQGFNNVKDPPPGFPSGATGDGIQDDAPEIQAWINASGAGGSQRGTVYFPPGIYKIDSPLTIPSETRLTGHDENSVILAGSGITHMLVNASASGNDDIHIEHLTLNANNRTTGNQLIHFRGSGTTYCTGVLIEHVRFRNQQSSAVGVILFDLKESAVNECFFEEIKSTALYVGRSCTDVLIQGNLFERCHNDNIAIVFGTAGSTQTAPNRISVLGNVCTIDTSSANTSQLNAGVSIYGGKSIDVVGNIVTSGYVAGIQISCHAESAEDIVIADNVIAESGHLPNPHPSAGHGLLVQAINGRSLRRVDVRSNIVSAPSFHGLRLVSGTGSSVDEIAIADNQFWHDQGASWLQSSPGSGVASASPGGSVENVRITGNDIRSAPGPGIVVSGSNNRRFDIQDNRILDSGKSTASQPGISLSSVQGALIANNRAQDARAQAQRTQEYGLKLASPAGETTIVGNVFTSNKFIGSNDSVIDVSGTYASDTRLRIRDNVGFNPWAGSKTLGGTLSSGPVQIGSFWYWWKEVGVTFEDPVTSVDVPFPADAVPRVLVTTDRQGYTAAAVNVNRTGFTLRVFAAANNASSPAPTQSDSVKVFWVAEPVD